MRRPGVALANQFLLQLQRHLGEGVGVSECAKALGMPINTFSHHMQEAYRQGFLVVRPKVSNAISSILRDFVYAEYGCKVKTVVAKGDPNNELFASLGVEQFLTTLRSLLTGDQKKVTILLISGSSVGELVTECANGTLWDEIMPPDILRREKDIRVVAGNITPIYGSELYGNAVASVVLLSKHIASKLPRCTVTPYGLAAPLVVTEQERKEADRMNKETLQIVAPSRLRPSEDSSIERFETEVDMVITGIGGYDQSQSRKASARTSVFQWVIQQEGLITDERLCGDVGFDGIDDDGKRLPLKRRRANDTDETVFIYSASSLELMKSVVSRGRTVLLVARSKRLGGTVDVNKARAIMACLKGRLVSSFITDRATAREILRTKQDLMQNLASDLPHRPEEQDDVLFLNQ